MSESNYPIGKFMQKSSFRLQQRVREWSKWHILEQSARTKGNCYQQGDLDVHSHSQREAQSEQEATVLSPDGLSHRVCLMAMDTEQGCLPKLEAWQPKSKQGNDHVNKPIILASFWHHSLALMIPMGISC